MGRLNRLVMSSAVVLGAYAGGEETTAEATLEQTVVTATRTETPASAVGSAITVITRQEIENMNVTSVWEVLKTVPGIDFKQTGPNSNNSSIYIRGLKGYHTKVMIDGIAVQDPSGTQVLPILNIMSTSEVERIEVIRGAASTLYGSNAMGGVVNIITRRAETGLHGSIDTEFGSHQFQRHAGTLSGQQGPVDFSLGAQWLSEGGISALKEPSQNNDKDSFRDASLFGKLGLALDDYTRLQLFARYSDSDQEYDTFSPATPWGPAIPDDGDVHAVTWATGAELSRKEILDGLWDTRLSLSYLEAMRNYRDDFEYGAGDRYIGKTIEGKWQNDIHVTEQATLTVGYDYTEERAKVEDGAAAFPSPKTDHAYRTHSPYGQLQIEPVDNLFAVAGLRYNDHSVFGHETTYSASLAYFVEKTRTKLKTNWGTGYRAPSLTELYGPWGANPDLEPEESESWDIGFEQHAGQKVTFGATYFQNRVTNYIDYVQTAPFTWGYDQTSGIKIYGVETFVSYRPCDRLKLGVAYTRQHGNNMQTEVGRIPYIPEDKVSLTADYQATARLNVNLTGIYVGQRTTDNAGSNYLHGYTLINLAASYRINDNVEIYGRIHNLLDQDYEESIDFTGPYATYGISLYGGVKIYF